MKKILLLLVFGLFVVAPQFLKAQAISTYNFEARIEAYNAISGGVVITDDPAMNDEFFTAIPIGFEFYFNGTTYTQLGVSVRGYVNFGGNGSGINYPLFQNLTNSLSALSGVIRGQAGSEIRVQTLGLAPNRVFVAQWSNMRWDGSESNYNFQIRIHETTNRIEYHYGSFAHAGIDRIAQVSVFGNGTDFQNRTIAASQLWNTTNTGNSTQTNTGIRLQGNAYPTEGLVFSYFPQSPTVSISSTESNPTNASPIPVSIDFSEDVTGFVVGDIVVSGGTLSNFSGSGANYTVDVTPSADGTITVDVPAGVAQGTAASNSDAATFVIESDRSAPEVVLLAANINPAPINPGFTNVSVFELQLAFSEPIANFDLAALIVENATVALLHDDSQQNFTLEVTADSVTDSAHTVSVTVPQGVFVDEAGNALDDSETFSIMFGDVRPTAHFTSSVVNPIQGEPIAVTLTITEIFGEPVSGFDISDIETENVASIEWVGGTNPVFELEITPENVGNFNFTLSLPEGTVSDVAGNQSEASSAFNFSARRDMQTVPLPVMGLPGLTILALLILVVGIRSSSRRPHRQRRLYR